MRFKRIFIYYSLLISFLITSCSRDEFQATNSLEGEWEVIEITSIYGVYTSNGFQSTITVPESGDLGTFNFINKTVEYSFNRNDTLYMGNESWNLELEKINSGFTKVNKYTLTIGGQFLFDVSFGDETKNAEKNASSVTFIQNPDVDKEVSIMLKLDKK